jgi:hypothetical protein
MSLVTARRRATITAKMAARGRARRMGFSRWIHLGLVVACAATGCAHAPWHPYRGWVAWQRRDVVLYTDTIIEHRSALDWMVDISDVYRRTFFRDLPVAPLHALYLQGDGPSPLVTANGQYRYGALLGPVAAPLHEGRGLVMVGRFQWESQYAHLVAHHFISQAIPDAPIWFQEGFAEYLTVFQGQPGNGQLICFGVRQPAEQRMVTVRIEDLFALTWVDYNDSSAPWMAATAWALVDYLLHGEDGRWRLRFRDFMQALAARSSSQEAFATIYPDLPIAGLDERLRDHVHQLRPPLQHCPLPVVVAPPGPVGPPLSRTQVGEDAIRAAFQAIESLPGRRGYADFFL